MSSPRSSRLLPALLASTLLLAAGAASAGELISKTPSVHVALSHSINQAELADMLRAQGYSDVTLSSVAADPVNPHPETNPSQTSHPENTPVRNGWNGVAVKDGQLVQVYADL